MENSFYIVKTKSKVWEYDFNEESEIISEEDERFKKYEIGHTFSKLAADEKVFINSKLSNNNHNGIK